MMKKYILPAVPLLLMGCTAEKTAENIKPNIIFILADDLGYGDLSCYGQDSFQTPNLDRMAAEGIRFTNHYAGSTVCAPSRCALMTGLDMGHALIRANADLPLQPEDTTVAELLQSVGYSTGAYGKWGLGRAGSSGIPNRKGFDDFCGYLDQIRAHNAYPDWIWENEDTLWLDNKVEIIPESYAKGIGMAAMEKNTHTHDIFTDKSLEFIKKNKDNPFFLYLPYTLPHANNEAWYWDLIGMETPDTSLFRDKPWPDTQQAHASMIAVLDRDVGKIMDLLRDLDIVENTLVVFTSDNGPHSEGGAIPEFFDSNGPLRGIKRDLYDGGIRVPMIAWWPGTIEGGRTSDHISAFWDFLPTACEIGGIENVPFTNGISYLPELKGEVQESHSYLYWEFASVGGKKAIRKANWKAVKTGLFENPDAKVELFDLKKDPGETRDVASEYPAVVSEMEKLFDSSRTPAETERFEFNRD